MSVQFGRMASAQYSDTTGMSYRQVAETMGLPSENTTNVLFLRARAELRKRI